MGLVLSAGSGNTLIGNAADFDLEDSLTTET